MNVKAMSSMAFAVELVMGIVSMPYVETGSTYALYSFDLRAVGQLVPRRLILAMHACIALFVFVMSAFKYG